MGGSDDPSNLIELTVEEHAEAHRKLWEEHGCWQDELAWKGLLQMINRQELISQIISNTHKGKIVSTETRNKLSNSLKGIKRPKTEKWKQNQSNRMSGENNPMYGRVSAVKGKTWEWKKSSKENLKLSWHKREKMTCIKCGKSMYKSNFIKWGHGEFCEK